MSVPTVAILILCVLDLLLLLDVSLSQLKQVYDPAGIMDKCAFRSSMNLRLNVSGPSNQI